MKYLIIAALVYVAQLGSAQPKVLFDYDAAGNRIMRYRVTSLVATEQSNEETNLLENFAKFDDKQSFLLEEINISPNPTTDKVVVEISTYEMEPASIFLYNGHAQILRSADKVNRLKEFDISDLPAGTYYCRIETKSKFGIWKIIKIK